MEITSTKYCGIVYVSGHGSAYCNRYVRCINIKYIRGNIAIF